MSKTGRKKRAVLVTGAGGYIGRLLLKALYAERKDFRALVAADVRETPRGEQESEIDYVRADVRSPKMVDLLNRFQINMVVHLASIVTPGRGSNRAFLYSVDVLGTKNMLKACVESGVEKVIVTSSGAAYGYYPDNPARLNENHALRGNPEFAYSDHKRLVEEMLSRYRTTYPQLKQLIFRPGTILGDTAANQITDLFQKRVIIGLRGVDSPFVLIWDQDVVGCILKGIREDVTGIYNLAGDGVLSLREMAGMMGKPYLPLPAVMVKGALWLLKRLGLTQYGPEQLDFLRYRPVLSNQRLKSEFGYIPEKSTRQVFEYYLERH